MEGGVIHLKKEKSSVRTFLRFCPSKKKEYCENSKESQWIFNTGDHGKSVKASRKSSISKTRCCTVTDEIFKEDVCNSEIYRRTMLQQHAVNVLDGISTNIIICGPHKTGKTNLLIGSQRSIGLVLQSIYDIFAAIRCYTSGIHLNEKGVNTETNGNFDRLFVVKASVLEIGEDSSNFKLDNVRDLINPENPLQLVKNLGELGYTIRGEHEHLFENEEKLVASILSAVAKKKVLDSIRRERLNERKKKKTPEQIQHTIFGDFGERWIKDDVLGSLVITISVESVDKSELENNIKKSEKVVNTTHVNVGTLRFFEISSCVSTSSKVKTVIPLFGLLDLSFEIRKYCYTNEKSNRINITNISSYIASTITESNLIVIGALSRSPIEKKCCIRPVLAPYDNQSTVQPHSIFDTLQLLEYIGNSMKFPIYPQRNCYKKPFIQSKLIEICRKNAMGDNNKIYGKMIIKSERGIWQSESSGRVTRIIRLLTFINRSIEGSGILRILMSGNEDDIIRIYCESIIGSGVIDLDGYQTNSSAGNWFQIDDNKLPKQKLEERRKLGYINQIEQKHFKDVNIQKTVLSDDKKVRFEHEKKEIKNGIDDQIDKKMRNLDFTTKNNKIDSIHYKDASENKAPKQIKQSLKFDEVLLSSSDDEHLSDENGVDITDIFDSRALENDKKELDKDFNVNLCEKLDENGGISNEKMCISGNIGKNKNIDKCIGDSVQFNNYMDEKIGPDSNIFDPVKQYEKLLKKTISLNKLQKSIMENQEKIFRDKCIDADLDDKNMNHYISNLEGKSPSIYYPLANKKAIEASKKAIEASKKAIAASKHFYEKNVNHTRGKIHEQIPASKNFPQVDIYAPSYDSDIEYDKFQNPKNIVFDLKSPNESDEESLEQPLKPHYETKYSGEKNTCPCCEQLSKRNKCNCHYADASVNFNGISETSVNTDKSLFLYYEPGAGINEKIKPNGRSWDIFVNVPERFEGANSLGFGNRRSYQDINQEHRHDYFNDYSITPDTPIKDSFETIEDEYFSSNTSENDKNMLQSEMSEQSKFATLNNNTNNDNMNREDHVTIENETERIKHNILDDLMEIKKQTSNLKHQFQLDPKLFRPLYDSNTPELCSNIFKDTYDERVGNFDSVYCLTNHQNLTRRSSFENSNHLHYKSENHTSSDYSNYNSENSSGGNSLENINFTSHQRNQYCSPNNTENYSQDKYLEEIEMDINEQISHFPGYVNSNIFDKTYSEESEICNNNSSNHNTIPIEGIIREVGCCHTKYILPFPKHLKPQIIRGTNNFQFPYLKSLY
ncbi:TRAFAC type P-loop GTPase that may be related tokinesin [Cryptosporidium canis]|uniref:TRAFAC type P-loop GTPase that may be related tokinesin n=1 Tax=Cryptosporidium canis TaxID=195482 RepID=A0ABQ8P2L6_9CRYT|nr:TRAFAC type P-loop GTPase that may be related tokinesin [Cryptosporidium canis]KAJ1612257.1 TRAFAC type P-loop GTPase that may be related tokinesin [Cryptosporidium canis]